MTVNTYGPTAYARLVLNVHAEDINEEGALEVIEKNIKNFTWKEIEDFFNSKND